MRYLDKLLLGAELGALQEVHGNKEHVDHVLKKNIRGHRWFHLAAVQQDGTENSRAGGLLFLMANSLFSMVQHAEVQVYVPGRVGKLILTFSSHTVIFWNIHNYILTPEAKAEISRALMADAEAAAADP
eukprot:6849025-Karenia_brevis.AAC.1